jgi:hypothetical protein
VERSSTEISLAESDAVQFPGCEDVAVLLRALDAVVPRGSILCVEGPTDRKIIEFLRARPAPNPATVRRGTTWPRSKQFHLPIEGTNLEELARLTEHLAMPEVCDHIVVYKNGMVLLTAYDVGADGAIWVSNALSAESVTSLRTAVHPAAD